MNTLVVPLSQAAATLWKTAAFMDLDPWIKSRAGKSGMTDGG